VFRKVNISEANLHHLKQQYGAMAIYEVNDLTVLSEVNAAQSGSLPTRS